MGRKIGVYLTNEAYEIYKRIPNKVRGLFLSELIVYAHKHGIAKEVLTQMFGLTSDTDSHRQNSRNDEDLSDISISL